MHALITGCTGQDGAYLSQLLLSKGFKVTGTSPRRSDDGRSLWRLDELGVLQHENFKHEALDITCSAAVNTAIVNNCYDQVYNLAAQSFVKESFVSPTATTQINYVGVLNLLEAIRKWSPYTCFYQASTSEMFGTADDYIQSEVTPFHPRSPYAIAKAAAHYATQMYREAYDIYACSGILFNHESPYRGIEFVTRKITDGAAQVFAGKQEHITLGNIDTQRDWGHARDYVRAMNMMLENDEPEDFVIATGQAHSIKDVLNIAFNHVGLDYRDHLKQDIKFMRPSDVPKLCGNAGKARAKLDWEPQILFQTMIEEMVDYDLQRHDIDPILLKAQMG
jgi:GDPmannose 4,6-dehydratase